MYMILIDFIFYNSDDENVKRMDLKHLRLRYIEKHVEEYGGRGQ